VWHVDGKRAIPSDAVAVRSDPGGPPVNKTPLTMMPIKRMYAMADCSQSMRRGLD
jgi:hypothetical protein